MCTYVFLCVGMSMWVWEPVEVRVVKSFGPGATGSRELLGRSAGNQESVLCWGILLLLSHLSSPGECNLKPDLMKTPIFSKESK